MRNRITKRASENWLVPKVIFKRVFVPTVVSEVGHGIKHLKHGIDSVILLALFYKFSPSTSKVD